MEAFVMQPGPAPVAPPTGMPAPPPPWGPSPWGPPPGPARPSELILAVAVIGVCVLILLAVVFLFVFLPASLIPPSGGGPKPQVTVSSTEVVTNGFSFTIAGASQTKPIANFKVNFLVGTSPGVAVTLTSSMTFDVSGSLYTVTYTDIGGEGALTGGDVFTATRAGGLTSGTTYHVLLLWSDGSQISDAAFTA